MPGGSLHTKIVAAVVEVVARDFSVYYTIAQLAALVGKTELQLQTAFRAVHGTTAIRYVRELRLMHAHVLLEKHDYPLRVVCELVGYPDASNFSCAFVKQFGYRPGAVQQAKKR